MKYRYYLYFRISEGLFQVKIYILETISFSRNSFCSLKEGKIWAEFQKILLFLLFSIVKSFDQMCILSNILAWIGQRKVEKYSLQCYCSLLFSIVKKGFLRRQKCVFATFSREPSNFSFIRYSKLCFRELFRNIKIKKPIYTFPDSGTIDWIGGKTYVR